MHTCIHAYMHTWSCRGEPYGTAGFANNSSTNVLSTKITFDRIVDNRCQREKEKQQELREVEQARLADLHHKGCRNSLNER